MHTQIQYLLRNEYKPADFESILSPRFSFSLINILASIKLLHFSILDFVCIFTKLKSVEKKNKNEVYPSKRKKENYQKKQKEVDFYGTLSMYFFPLPVST